LTRFLLAIDRFFSATRPAWMGLGQLGVALLGVHLAADRLDDSVYQALLWMNEGISPLMAKLALSGLDPEQLATPAGWVALVLELLADLFMLGALSLTAQAPELSWARYKERLTVRALVLPLFWAPVALAGAWVVGMAAEDLLAGWHAQGAQIVGWVAAALVAWRLGFTGWRRVVGGLDLPKSAAEGAKVLKVIPRWRLDGLGWAPLLVLLAALATRHGLPIWGWM
jgi:hypothetical protein